MQDETALRLVEQLYRHGAHSPTEHQALRQILQMAMKWFADGGSSDDALPKMRG